MPDLRVACTADANYAPYCGAMLQGLLQQHPAGLTVHLLHLPDLPAPLLAAMRTQVENGGGRWNPLVADPGTIADLPRMRRIPAAMWLRCLLPELLPQAERVLYLDVDTLALQPLDPLFNTAFEGQLVAAVDNVLPADLTARPAALGLNSRYFNSGMLLMDLESMRREGTTRKLLDCARERAAELLWPDQDALNIVLGNRRKAVHPRWNCQNSFFYWRERSIEVLGRSALDEAVGAPAVLHFEGPAWAKPWHFLNDHPYRPSWQQVQRASGWALPVPADPLKRVLGRLPVPVIGALRSIAGYPRPHSPSRRS